MRVLVSGATGFLGRHLCEALARRRHEVRRLRRGGVRGVATDFGWDPQAGRLDPAALEGVDAVVHLAGASLTEGRWDEAMKQRLRDSRVAPTRLLVDALAARERRPATLLAASAVGWYGDRGDQVLDEASAPGADFLAGLCRDWEAESVRAAELGLRVLRLRTGMVLGPDGGALKRLRLPFRLGLGGRLGSGRQWCSWIALHDWVGAIIFLLERPELSGAVNLTAPNPVTNAQFTRGLARAFNRPALLPLPAFALKAALGELAEAVLLGGQRALPLRLQQAGFRWETPFLGEALSRLIAGPAA